MIMKWRNVHICPPNFFHYIFFLRPLPVIVFAQLLTRFQLLVMCFCLLSQGEGDRKQDLWVTLLLPASVMQDTQLYHLIMEI